MLAASLALAACSQTERMRPAPVMPEWGRVGPSASYRLQIGDVLDLKLLHTPELNEEVVVRPDGHISTSLVTDELAAGRTVPELTAVLKKDYSHDLQNPRISVVVKSFVPAKIYVAGEVANPGEFTSVGQPPTLSQAIARAGGTKLSSDDSSIFIIRRGPDDRPKLLSVRYRAIENGQPNADVRLAPYDVVYVPKNGAAKVYKWYNQFIQQFANPALGFSYIINNPEVGSVVATPVR